MADQKSSSREQVKQIIAEIESNIQELFQSEKYFDYLRTMSRFHNYSFNNTILIYAQMPHATQVAGFNKWKELGRHVKKGEHGITIIAPTPFKKKVEKMKLDPDTNAPMLDGDGNIITEEKTVEIPLFRPVKVFDYSQTDGKPLPQLASDLTGDVRQYEVFMEALRRTSPVPITVEKVSPGMDGYFDPIKQRIAIREGMSEVQTVCAAVHEITHSILHNREQDRLAAAAGSTEPPKPKDRKTEEVEAESVSYAVCQYYGIDTAANSIGYIAGWSSGRDMKELKASLDTITKTVNSLIKDIDRHFAEICKERGIDLTAQPDAAIVYKMEANPLTAGAEDRFLVQSYEVTGTDTLTPREVVFMGNAPQCQEIIEKLKAGTVNAQEVRAQYLREHTAPEDEPDSPELFATDLYEHLSALQENGIELLSAHRDVRAHFMKCLEQGQFESLRDILRDSAEHTGTLNTPLMDRLDALNDQWDASLTYQVQPFMPDSSLDRAIVQAYYTVDGEPTLYDTLFAGTVAHCNELAEKLNAGSITARAVRAMDDEPWPEFTPPAAAQPEQDEALFLVNGNTYVHIQRADEGGVDYTLYDKTTLRDLEGGQIDMDDTSPGFMDRALKEVCYPNGITPVTIELVSLDMVNTLHDAQYAPPDPANPHYEELVEHFAKEDAPLWDTTLDEYPMPPQIPQEGLRAYGYDEDSLIPVGHELAQRFFEQDVPLYAAGESGYFNMIFEPEELDAPDIRIFAIPRGDWESSEDFRQAVAERMDRQAEREAAFLNHTGDCFAIYQLRDGDETRDLRYMPLPGQGVDKQFYELAYTAPLTEQDAGRDMPTVLDNLFQRFNIHHPADYQRPSMSISDIVAVKQDGVLTCHYVDRFAFTELHGFLPQDNPLKNAEMALEDDYNMIDGVINNGPKEPQEGPSVAELEAQVKAGQTISLMDLASAVQREEREKRSVLAKLKSKQAEPSQPRTAPKKSAERER